MTTGVVRSRVHGFSRFYLDPLLRICISHSAIRLHLVFEIGYPLIENVAVINAGGNSVSGRINTFNDVERIARSLCRLVARQFSVVVVNPRL